MGNIEVYNVNVASHDRLITPEQLKAALPMSASVHDTLVANRLVIENILDRRDARIFVVFGPCPIHDPLAALDSARCLKVLDDEVDHTLYFVMGVYFEKPLTKVHWNGVAVHR